MHVYLDGEAGSGARAFPVAAAAPRDDLCDAIGSCAHGFTFPIPNAYRDGASHSAFVYGIDTGGGTNPLLDGSGAVFSCEPPVLAEGPLRHITSPEVMTAWSFSFDDVASYGTLPNPLGEAWPDDLRLVQADGAPEVYLVDGGSKRHVASPEVMSAWRFAFGAVEVVTPADLDAFVDGLALPLAPVLVRAAGDPAIYLIDRLAPADGGEGEGEKDGDGAPLPPSATPGCTSTMPPAPIALLALLALRLVRKRAVAHVRACRT